MPRRTRMYCPGYVYHVVQRGNNRGCCFQDEEDYQRYLDLMATMLRRYENALHAYCLMTNHVHLLLSPSTDTSISNLMKVQCSTYAQYVNRKYDRTGTLWEGRHKASAVDSERYLIKCHHYIEMNPVAANIVQRPGDYRWSSFRENSSGHPHDLITPHACYLALGITPDLRQIRYQALFQQRLEPEDVAYIRESAASSMPVGTPQFCEEMQAVLGRPLGKRSRGRPKGQLIKK